MKKLVAILTAIFMAAFLVAYMVSTGMAGPTAQPDDSSRDRPRGADPLDLPRIGVDELPEGVQPPRALSWQEQGEIQVMIELEGTPTAETYARAVSEGLRAQAATSAQAQLAQIEAAQQALLPALQELDATVLYRTQRVYNGIAAVVDASQVLRIQQLPGVKAVHPLAQHERAHRTSVPLIGAPALWDDAGLDLAGDGITIGIIDTGIDYLHANFGGNGAITPTLYADNDTTVVGDIPGFPSVKIAGGYDFVGDNYDSSGDSGSPIPAPDPDPMDCNGHGTHVAGTAAGYGVNGDGTTFEGDYNADLSFEDFRIAPGVAPQATLYALRVFGCGGSTGVTTQAIEWAVDPNGDGDFSDHLDVINMSLGASYGSLVDASVIASNNAAAVGVVVVASAGNSDDVYYITGAPAIADRALSVAASVDASSVLDGFRVNNGSVAGVHPAAKGVAFDWTDFTAITGTLTFPADQPTGCEPFSEANQALIEGTIVLLTWTDGECGSATRGNNLEDAGAIGMLLADNSEIFDLSIFGSDEMPSYSIPKEVGDALIAAVGEDLSVTLSSEYDNSIFYNKPEYTDAVAAFSSRGPRRDNLLKPDITAPGVTVFSAASGTGDEGASFGGTSMAAPHVSGVMALLRQLHPDWTTEELKALAMNTALHNLRLGDIASTEVGPGRIGAGRVNVYNASLTEVVAYNAGRPGAVSVSFGEVEVLDTTTLTRTVRIVNKGDSDATYLLSYVPMVDIPGVEYTLSDDSVTVPADSFVEVQIYMTANADEMLHTHDPSIATDVFDVPVNWISEEAGYLQLMPEETQFIAELSGDQEAPPVETDASGTATFTYDADSGELDYELDAQDLSSEEQAAHIHLGLPGVSGGVVHPLYNRADDGDLPKSGSVTLTPEQLHMLLSGAYYVNVHTTDFGGGEIRGQIVLDGPGPLRVPIYATARPASDMEAVPDTVDLSDSEIALQGQDLTGSDTPTETASLVTALELQITSPNEFMSTTETDNADLADVGVSSDFAAAGDIGDTLISFGIASHGEWASPNEVEFDVYIDANQDGAVDFILFNYNLSLVGYGADTHYSFLFDFTPADPSFPFIPQHFVNGVSPEQNTHLFNNNVMVLPVFAADLGLTNDDASFDYFVVSWSRDNGFAEPIEVSALKTYDAANPGIDFNGGVAGVPLWSDVDGATIAMAGDFSAFTANQSEGVLLLHHHNVEGDRVEVLDVPIFERYLPYVFKQ